MMVPPENEPDINSFELIRLFRYLRVADVCDAMDGIVVVPIEVAEAVAIHARAVLLADMRGRNGLYKRAGLSPDATIDDETVEAYYRQFK
jgi:hypothetical protein